MKRERRGKEKGRKKRERGRTIKREMGRLANIGYYIYHPLALVAG